MNLLSKRNFVLLLAGVLVVAFGFMSLYLNDKKAMKEKEAMQMQQTQEVMQPPLSNSDNVEDIEKDLDDTELQDIDSELQDMEKEIDTSF